MVKMLTLIFVVLLISNGVYCYSLRKYLFSEELDGANTLDVKFTNNNQDYVVTVNNMEWLYSGTTQFRNNKSWVNAKISSTVTKNGTDNLGKYSEFVIEYVDTNDNNIKFNTGFRQYMSNQNIIIFTQSFPNNLNDTNVSYDSVITSFPSFKLLNTSSVNLGYMHWAGGMAGNHPQYGKFNLMQSSSLQGGISNSGPLVLFDSNLTNCIVISSLTYSMTANHEIIESQDKTYKTLRYGIQGGVQNVDNGFNISFIMTLTPNGGGINSGMRYFGDNYLKYYNKPKGNSHSRDYTLQYLGYGTDNGAYYFYYPIPNMTYADTLISIKKYHDEIGIKSKWIQLDQWYYQQTWPGQDCYTSNCHDYNFTANITLFPDGILPVYQQTGWYFLSQTDPWAYDNVYARDLNIDFAYNETIWSATPNTPKFYDYLFSINNKEKWGLVAFERDWLSYITDNFEIIHNNTDYGENWFKGMGQGAENHNLSGIQLCMSYPRHILSSALSLSFTQARVSGDYHPGHSNWKIGEGSIFVSAIDIAPSKDTWWSNNTNQTTGMRGRCSKGCVEPYNRLQSLIVALSNGPNYSGDRIGYANSSLIMMCCNSDGLLLRPDISATSMDSVILSKANFGNSDMRINGELYSSMSYINNVYMYYYIFAAVIQTNNYKLYPNELSFYSNQTLLVDNYLVYEANTTDQYVDFNANSPLNIVKCNEFDFQYYTVIPINKGYDTDQWYLAGELNKWIKVSNQRFNTINLYNNGSITVEIEGVQKENVIIAFVNGKTKQQQIVECQITKTNGIATVFVPQGYCE